MAPDEAHPDPETLQEIFVEKVDLEANRLHLANGRSVPLSQTSTLSATESETWPAPRAPAGGSPAGASHQPGSTYHSAGVPVV